MDSLSSRTVGALVAERPSRARAFEDLGIDYCCGGKKPLTEACAEHGLDLDAVITRLREAEATAGPSEVDWTQQSLTALADHIEDTHHAYLREELPRLTSLTQKVASRHGERRPEYVEVADVFGALRAELESHMMKEEMILFPICRQLDEAEGPAAFHCGSVRNPIRVMEIEHDHAAAALQRMRQLTAGFTPPDDACTTLRVMLDSLAVLEKDLHEHIHKENNILFPRAAAREELLSGAGN
jgi:regulator of cell morphogenesis and NO signaling